MRPTRLSSLPSSRISTPFASGSSKNVASVSNSQHTSFRNFATVKTDGPAPESVARGFFEGKLKSKQLFPYPEAVDADMKETLQMLVGPVTHFFEEVNDPAKNDEISKIPDESMQAMRELGLFGLQVPTEHGGVGLTNTGYARMVEIVGGNDFGVGIALGAHQSIGFKGILLDGNEAQKAKYLPKLASGEHIAAFSLTEPSSGSDANSVKTRAKLSEDGKHYILNGSKIWISNGGIAEIFTVFAQTEVDDPKTGGKKDKVTAFIVERGFGGVTHGAPEKKMGIKASNTAEVYFENTKVPVENVLGEVGGGFKVAMRILNNGRFGMGAGLTGTMKKCIKIAVDHASGRTQFGLKIKDFGLIKDKIAQMSLKLYATESMAYMVSALMDKGSQDYQIEAAIAKVYASEAAWWTCDETIQVLGGMGYMKDTGVERILRDLRIFRIFEGTNDILRLFVAGAGLQTTGERLKNAQKALTSGNVSAFWDYFSGEGKKQWSALVKNYASTSLVCPGLTEAAKLLESYSFSFGTYCDGLVMKYKKDIEKEQLQLKRVAEISMELMAMAAVVSRAQRSVDKNSPSKDHEILLADTYCKEAALKIDVAFKQLRKNFDSSIYKISDQIFAEGNYIPIHPLGF